jgi:hypothetical protein
MKKLILDKDSIQQLVDSNKDRLVGEPVCLDGPGNPGVTSEVGRERGSLRAHGQAIVAR